MAVKFILSNIPECLSKIFKLYAPLSNRIYHPIAWLKECVGRARFRGTIRFDCIVSLRSFISMCCSEMHSMYFS